MKVELAMPHRWPQSLAIALIAALVASCASKPKDDPEPKKSPPPTVTDDANSVAEPPAAVKNQVKTKTLKATRTRIELADLPKPFATSSARKGPDVVPVPDSPVLNVPDGFTVNIFAADLDRPRWLALTPSGEVLVTETRSNRIRLLADRDGDGVAEIRETFATKDNGVEIPFGMAFAGDSFFLGNTADVRRYAYKLGQTSVSGKGEQVTKLTPGGYRQHWTRNVVTAPDGKKLYFSIGSESNVSREPLPRAAVSVMNLDGSDRRVFSHGLRNPVGLDFHPVTGELYVTVNERDALGDDLVPDYMTRVRDGEFFGWPFAYLSPKLLDPRRMKGRVSESTLR